MEQTTDTNRMINAAYTTSACYVVVVHTFLCRIVVSDVSYDSTNRCAMWHAVVLLTTTT